MTHNNQLIFLHHCWKINLVPQTLIFIHTISCLFLFVCFVMPLYYRHKSMTDGMFITVFEDGE